MGYKEMYEEWLNNPYFDDATKAELKAIEGNEKEIEDRFYMDLEDLYLKKNGILFLQQFLFIFPTNPLRSHPTPYPTLSAIHHSPVWYHRQSTTILLRFLSLHPSDNKFQE